LISTQAAIAEEGVASASVLFIVARGDCSSFKPHAARCPSFASHLKDAKAAGVNLIARRLRWEVRGGIAHAFDDGAIPVDVV
jgi:DNA-binding sugar fermentation-stimulating protein